MDGLSVPYSPIWIHQMAMAGTPNGGLLYLAGRATNITYIPPKIEGQVVKMQYITPRTSLKQIVCDPDWSETKYFATYDFEGMVHVWDMDTRCVVKAHRGHSHTPAQAPSRNNRQNHRGGRGGGKIYTRNDENKAGGAMCFLRNRKLLSNQDNVFVVFCLASNKYTSFSIDALYERDPIAVLKASPYSDAMVACGSTRGLVTIVNIVDKNIIHKFRGHDTSITSLGWMQMTVSGGQAPGTDRPKAVSARSAEEIKLRGKPVPIVDADDAFDINDFNDDADVFGVNNKPTYGIENENREKIVPNENFNFAEECQTLKDVMLQGAKEQLDECTISTDFEKLSMSTDGIAASVSNDIPIDQQDYISKQIASAMLDTTQSSEELKEPQIVSNGNGSVLENSTELPSNGISNKITMVASGSKENIIWVWYVEDQAQTYQPHKIALKRAPKNSPMQDKNTMLSWINEHTIITNSPSGEISVVELTAYSDEIKSSVIENRYDSNGVNGLYSCPTASGEEAMIWTRSIHHQLRCYTVSDTPKLLRSFTTLATGMTTIRECPHDFNKIAIGGITRRIEIMNLSTLTTENIVLTSYANSVKSKVQYLAWHPKSENLLAFATEEGRVGVFDMNKQNATPQLVTPFTNSSIYQLAWAQVCDNPDVPDSSRYVLLACSDRKFFYIPESGDNKYRAIHIKIESEISSVSAGTKYIALGSQDGYVIFYKLFIKGSVLGKFVWSSKISTKYISECSWSTVNPNKLAVTCSDKGFKVFDCVEDDTIKELAECMDLSGSTSVKWSNESEHRLVVTGFDGTVRVFETDTMTCTSIYQSKGAMLSAVFMPTNEDYVMCTGQRETMFVFDRRTRMDEPKKSSSKGEKQYDDHFQWGLALDNEPQKMVALEKKNLRKMAKKAQKQQSSEGDESDVGIISKSVPDDHEHGSTNGGMQFNYTTICYLTQKELHKDALECLEMLVSGNNDYKDKHNSRLFGDRGAVRSLLAAELKNHKLSMSESIGQILIPQLLNELEAEITCASTEKRLTEQHLARAPMISYSFWKQCCEWYFKQMVELGFPLMALPYLISFQDISEAIDILCATNYYREAWILAQLNREQGDPVFKTIADKWLQWLESKGNLDGAAYIAAAIGDHNRALAFLQKRKNPTETIVKIIEILQAKISPN